MEINLTISNPITGYKVVYFTTKINSNVHKLFNTRSEVRRFLITNSNVLQDYVVYEMQGTKVSAVVTQQFKY